jgi:xanthine dehydrogenase YagR molybdenum-binding subunit
VTTTAYIGQSINRTDGPAKVTGDAKYAFEHNAENLAYGFVVSSAVARGTIRRIDASAALGLPGVLQVLTHENTPRVSPANGEIPDEDKSPGTPFIPLQDGEVRFSHQPVALVVAETFELARYAASLVHVEYDVAEHMTDLDAVREQAHKPKPRFGLEAVPKPRGEAKRAFGDATVQVDEHYHVPAEHHNPMEPFGTTAVWESDERITVYDKTQGVQNVRSYLCALFGCSDDQMRVLAPFVGGAFGSGLRPQYPAFLAVLAARALKRPVKLSLTRQQMFSLQYRPMAWQHVSLGASPDGKLEAIMHEAISNTSRFEDYSETIVPWTGMLYQCENVTLKYKLASLDLNTPCDMRAPGAAWGLYALECAMDELAAKLHIDPLELRLKNYAERDQNESQPFSSKALRECYHQAAARFDWSRRNPTPRSMRDGDTLIGLGMATGAWDAFQVQASARCVLKADGTAIVSSATEDIGTGTYTVMTQIAADTLGLPLDRVTFELGDSSLPRAPLEGGSFTLSSVGSAVKAACEKVRERLFALAQRTDESPLADVALEDVTFTDGHVRMRHEPSRSVSFMDAMRHSRTKTIDKTVSARPSPKRKKISCYTHSAIFAEVHIDEDFGTIHVPRVVTAVTPGYPVNPKTARSQVMGGVVWGIGMALEEESVIDHAFGRFMNHNLAEYHVPVNADVHDIDVIFVEEQDHIVNPLGVKGLGEIGIVGVAAAIANAVYHATGKRVRDLPITLDKVM